jgi:hypothetical protein
MRGGPSEPALSDTPKYRRTWRKSAGMQLLSMNYPAASCEVSMKGKELNPDASIEEFSRLKTIAFH